MTFHHFVYGASRTGKTTFAARLAKQPNERLLVVTREPGPAQAALDAEGVEAKVLVPKAPEEVFVFLDYPKAYLDRNLPELDPTMILFDNLQGFQQLILGEGAQKEQNIAGVIIPAKAATGIMALPVKRADEAIGAFAQLDYGALGRYTRRFLTLIDTLPYSTVITATEQLGFDEKHLKEKEGLSAQQAAGRPRRVKGWPATEGALTKQVLPSLVSGAFIHLSVNDEARHLMHIRPHEDDLNVEWFADPRGLKPGLKSPIDWTGKSPREVLC